MKRQRRFSSQTLPSSERNLSLVLFGIECEFTRTIFAHLADSGVPIRLICLPGPETLDEPIVQRPPSKANLRFIQPSPGTVTGLAHGHGLDVWRVGDLRAPETVEHFERLDADVGIVACFTRLIPNSIATSFRLGAVNIHPSLLPDKRGPDPQFWTLKEGMGRAGVTIHQITDRFDAGPILARKSLDLPDGVAEPELDRQTAVAGAELLIDLLPELVAGEQFVVPQDEGKATYAPHPTWHDFRLDRSRPARAAYNFARGVRDRGVPLLVEIGGADWIVDEVVAYWNDVAGVDRPAGPDEVLIKFDPGILLAKVRAADSR